MPDSMAYDYEVEERGGRTREEWSRLFREATTDLRVARAELRRSLDELEELGEQGQWKMAPPGLDQLKPPADPTRDNQRPAGAPLDYGLSTQIRRQKDEVARAERALRDLQVEANLAGVPEEWRR